MHTWVVLMLSYLLVKKMYTHIYTHDGILLNHKEDKVLPLVTTWMNLEGIVLSEVSEGER